MITFEPLEERHRKPVVDVYNYYVRNTNYAYRREEVDYGHFDKYLANARELCGFAVLDGEGKVIGFCQLKPFDSVSTFERSAELSYFLEPGSTGKGIGAIVFAKLLEEARKRGKTRLFASISGDNAASLKFHEKQGFRECGRFRGAGNKFGRDFDIVYMQKEI